MIVCILQDILKNILIFSLRIEKSSFPKPLTIKQETKCFKNIKSKVDVDKNRELLIKHNLRLVAHISKKYYSSFFTEQDDLISIGTIGLIKAVGSYDPEKKIKFSTYASRCIENEILMHFRQQRKNSNMLYLDDLTGCFSDGSGSSFLNMITDESDILDIVELRFKSNILYSYMERFLTKKEKAVLEYRYGLYGKTPLTQQETADKLKISRSYVSRIEKKAIEKLNFEFLKKN